MINTVHDSDCYDDKIRLLIDCTVVSVEVTMIEMYFTTAVTLGWRSRLLLIPNQDGTKFAGIEFHPICDSQALEAAAVGE